MDESPDHATPDAKPAPRAGRGTTILILLLITAQAASSAYLFWLHTQFETLQQDAPSATAMPAPADLSGIEDRIASLESVLSRIDAEMTALTADLSTYDMPTIQGALGELQGEVKQLKANSLSDERIHSMLKVAEKIEAVNQRVEQDQQAKWQQIQMLAALDALESAVRSGNGYEGAYRAMYRAAGDVPEVLAQLRALEDGVTQGIATQEQLQRQFAESIQAYLSQGNDNSNQTWAAVKRNLSSLVTVRKVGADHAGDDSQSRIARAEAALAEGNIVAARDEIIALPAADAKPFSRWLQHAEAHLHAQDALRAIRSHTLQPLKE